MVRPMRSRTKGLFNLDELVNDFNSYEKKETVKKSKKAKVTLPKEIKNKATKSASSREFEYRYKEGLFSSFTSKDWLMYWQMKAREHGVAYQVGNYPKEYAILKALAKKYNEMDMKLMIDFLWDCDHDLYNKKIMGTWILSGGWQNSVYQCAVGWKNGTYKKKSEYYKGTKKRNREWVNNSEEKDNEIFL